MIKRTQKYVVTQQQQQQSLLANQGQHVWLEITAINIEKNGIKPCTAMLEVTDRLKCSVTSK